MKTYLCTSNSEGGLTCRPIVENSQKKDSQTVGRRFQCTSDDCEPGHSGLVRIEAPSKNQIQRFAQNNRTVKSNTKISKSDQRQKVSATASLFSSTTPGVYNNIIVPACATSLNFTVVGGSGGNAGTVITGGRGASISGSIPVNPGDNLTLTVGANGGIKPNNGGGAGTGNGGNGGAYGVIGATLYPGGGGGGSRILNNTSGVFIIAGAGGGGGLNYSGGDAGSNGGGGTVGGGAGTQTGPGAGGVPTGSTNPGLPGSGMNGGNGGGSNGGGGGGGYFGGGGGSNNGGGGGGGSSYIPSSATGVTSGFDSTKTPQIIITYTTDPNCGSLPIQVSKTANTKIDTLYTWDLIKTVDQSNVTLQAGQTTNVNYTVKAGPQSESDTYTVYGTISIFNPNSVSSTNNVVIDGVQDPTGTPISGSYPQVLPPQQTLTVNYSYAVNSNASGTNTATVTAHVENSGGTIIVPSYDTLATASYTFSPPTIQNSINGIVRLDDMTNSTILAWPSSSTTTYAETIGPYNSCGQDMVVNEAQLLALDPLGSGNVVGVLATASAIVNVTIDTIPTLSISKTANTEITRTYQWGISKTVTPSTVNLAVGATSPASYTVQVSPSGYSDSNPQVYGTITIANTDTSNCSRVLNINSMTDSLPGTQFQPPFVPFSLSPGESTSFQYSALVSSTNPGTNTVTVNASWSDPDAGSNNFSGSANYSFSTPTSIIEEDEIVNITDSLVGSLGSVSWPNGFTKTYSVNVGPYSTCGNFVINNSASIIDDEDPNEILATNSAIMNVYVTKDPIPTVTKTAYTELTRSYNWTVTKSATPTSVTLATGATSPIAYAVQVNPNGYNDSNFKVNGTITISNSDISSCGQSVTVNSISDSLPGATFSPSQTVPFTLAPGETRTFNYSAPVSNQNSGTNTVSVNITSGNTSNTYTASAPYDFTNPATVNEINPTVCVVDSMKGPLGSTAYPTGKAFNYSTNVGPYSTCGNYTVNNTVQVTDCGSTVLASASASVAVSVPCSTGCVRTQGYWKNHMTDPAWNSLGPQGGNTTFYLSGQTYKQVMNTSGGTSAYYTLALQFIAARLNIITGAPHSIIDSTMANAQSLFQTYTPAQVKALKSTSTVYKQFISYANTLASYNNGTLGVSSCTN